MRCPRHERAKCAMLGLGQRLDVVTDVKAVSSQPPRAAYLLRVRACLPVSGYTKLGQEPDIVSWASAPRLLTLPSDLLNGLEAPTALSSAVFLAADPPPSIWTTSPPGWAQDVATAWVDAPLLPLGLFLRVPAGTVRVWASLLAGQRRKRCDTSGRQGHS